MVLFLLKAITIFATIITSITSIYGFFYKKNSTIYIINLTFNIFYGVPVILDVLVGKPKYLPTFPGFEIATQDKLTQATYLIIVNLILLIMYIYKKKNKCIKNDKQNILSSKSERMIMIIPIILPVIYICFAPDILVYSEYGYFLKNTSSIEVMNFNSQLWNLTFLSIASIAVFIHSLNNKHNVVKMTVLLLPILIFDLWINGKRNIVILTACIFIYIYNDKKLFSKKFILIFSSFLIILMMLFNKFYQSTVRDLDSTSKETTYSDFRIDYGRDDVMKLAIYSNYNPENIKILDYKGQSLLYYPLFFIPRSIWENKPQPYYVYVVNASIGYDGDDYIGWGMTVSIFTELISNLGIIIGPLIGAIIICYLVKIADSSNSTLEKFITFYLAFTLIYNGAKLEFLILFLAIRLMKFIKFKLLKGKKIIW